MSQILATFKWQDQVTTKIDAESFEALYDMLSVILAHDPEGSWGDVIADGFEFQPLKGPFNNIEPLNEFKNIPTGLLVAVLRVLEKCK